MIVIIVPETQTASILNNVKFATGSGLSDDQLLFLIESSSPTALSLNTGNSPNITIHGDFFVANGGGYTIGNGKTTIIDGRVFAGGGTATPTLVWNSNVTENDEAEVPEPGTCALMMAGLLAMVWIHRRRHKARA
jgi:hypothetical protein